MRKLLLSCFVGLLALTAGAQKENAWRTHVGTGFLPVDRAAQRSTFPKEFKLFDLDQQALRSQLFRVVDNAVSHTTTVYIPTAEGAFEAFEVVEASNFEPALQVRYPEIRAFSGRGITDPYATLKLSYSPQGVQGMIFRTGKANEFVEAYSADHTVYAAFSKQHTAPASGWSCSTVDEKLTDGLNQQVFRTVSTARSGGDLKTMRLAQSVTAEYSNYFGATNVGQIAQVLAGINATLTRCNGVYEKDLALHLNMIAASTNVIYFDPATDPYADGATGSGGAWNGQLQSTLTANIGESNYDIGHLFGASGGGGNAGCIGCICTNNQKGKGFTSPADAIPEGDNFDIDYVVHEIGHQLGGNHTFSHNNEGSGQNKEVGSGITIMGYAGITSRDVAPHSIDIYHATSIAQIQANLSAKSCPVTVPIANATPVVTSGSTYIIPISTPFALTGAATDADGDPLTYCWEQNDNALASQTGANSVASATKLTGPTFISFSPTASPTRVFPKLATILVGNLIAGPFPGGDAGANSEALSSVARTLNFRLTVRDNAPYSSTAPIKVGQTQFTDVAITVTNTSGPFAVTTPNTNVTWFGGTTQTVNWSVANTTLAPVSCANVRILLSTDGGYTWPIELVASTPNDGTETITVPAVTTSQARIKVESVGNIFFDISNADFSISAVSCAATVTTQPASTAVCPNGTATFTVGASGAPLSYQWQVSTNGGGSFSNIGGATAATYSFTATNADDGKQYRCVVTGGCGSAANSDAAILSVTAATTVNAQPAATSACNGAPASFGVTAAGGGLSYQWQVSTDGGANYSNVGGATSATYTFTAQAAQNGNMFRCVVSSTCSAPVTSSGAALTVTPAAAVSTQPIDAALCAGSNSTFSVAATGSSLGYQWQVSTDGGANYSNVANGGVYSGAATTQLSLTGVTSGLNGYRYRCVVSSICPSLNSNPAVLTVNTAPALVADASNTTVCAGSTANFSLTVSGSAPAYQWQMSTDGGANFTNVANGAGFSGANAASLTVNGTTAAQSGYQFRCQVSGTCTPGLTSAARTLTVNTPVAITTQPAAIAICAGQNTTFTVAATGTTPIYQWQLSTNGGTSFTDIPTATTTSLTLNGVTASMNGNIYRCVVTGAAPCGNLPSANALLTVNPIPVVTLAAAPYQSLFPGLSTTLMATATPSNVNYLWFRDGVQLTSVAGNTLPVNIDAIGAYRVRVTDAIGCNSTSALVVISDSVSNNLFIYPNPNNGVFQVRYFNAPGQSKARTLAVYDAKGSLVWVRSYTVAGMYNRMDVQLPAAAKGVYLVMLFDEVGKRMATGKVIVH